MKFRLFFLLSIIGAGLLGGCACNAGYYAPPYKPVIIGCTVAFVPTR